MPEKTTSITHADRVIFARPRITKGDLAAYYRAIAPLMLPHLAGRPLSLLRCPEGMSGECFYQRNWTGKERGVETTKVVDTDGKRRNYAIVHDLNGLLALVQFGVLEIHPWGSQADRLDAPDRVIFDLDPAPKVPWRSVVDGARELRERLRELGLESWLKTTGGKGLHVVLPIARTVDWKVVSLFARAVAERMVSENASRYLSVASKAERSGKIFVDWLRNSRGATAVAPWSARAREGAPVAVPLRWEELDDLDGADAFDIPAALTRARARDPWEAMLSKRQRLSRAVVAKLGV